MTNPKTFRGKSPSGKKDVEACRNWLKGNVTETTVTFGTHQTADAKRKADIVSLGTSAVTGTRARKLHQLILMIHPGETPRRKRRSKRNRRRRRKLPKRKRK